MSRPIDKSSLLAARIARAAARSHDRIIPARPVGSALRLTPAQESLWFLQQAAPFDTAYNVFRCFRFDRTDSSDVGGLQPDVLRKALHLMVGRHESLRTSIRAVDGLPIPALQDDPKPEVKIVAVGPDVSETKMTSLCTEFVKEPFDLSEAPLIRALVVTGSSAEYLVICVHHVACDEWSLEILLRELAEYYQGMSNRKPDGSVAQGDSSHVSDSVVSATSVPEKDLPQAVSFLDYASWYAGRIDTISDNNRVEPKLKASLDFWESILKDADSQELLNIRRPQQTDSTGDLLSLSIDKSASDTIRELARRESVTVFSILVAAFVALIFRYSREKLIRIGVPVTSRTTAGLDSVVGFLLNTLVLQIGVEGDYRFVDLVKKTSQSINAATANQDVPFDVLVREFSTGRSGTRNPFFDYMFVMVGSSERLKLGEMEGDVVTLNPHISKFDLTLFASNDPQMKVHAEFSRARFEKRDVEVLCGRYSRLVMAATADPATTVDELPLDERDPGSALVGEKLLMPEFPTVGSWVENIAAANPSAVAVRAPDASDGLNYETLAARSKVFSEWLSQSGLKPGQRVAVALDASVDFVPAVLAIWNHNCAFVPIDTSYPAEYLNRLFASADPAIVLCKSADVLTFPKQFIGRCFAVDGELDGSSSHQNQYDQKHAAVQASNGSAHSDDLAYLIYTSGSTGEPRGAAITHANLLSSTVARHQYYRDEPARFVVLSSSAFDSSIAGIWWTLTGGGEVTFVAASDRRDISNVADVIRTTSATHTLCTPLLYDAMLDFATDLSSLTTVIVAGESCSPTLVERHYAGSSARLFNEYGPTECTVWTSVHECQPDQRYADVPIGVPIPGTEMRVVGRDGVELPRGLIGELVVRSEGVSPGYFTGDSELTRLEFDNWYHTGDLGWIDQEIHFVGRIDNQVKIRGFRVEPSEIEAALKDHCDVIDAVVVVR